MVVVLFCALFLAFWTGLVGIEKTDKKLLSDEVVGRGDDDDKSGTREGKIVDEDEKKWDELTVSQQEDVLAILNRQGFASLEAFFASAPKQTRTFTAVVEKCPDTGLYMAHIPGFPGAHTDGVTMEELSQNMRDVIELLLEDGGEPVVSEFVGTLRIAVSKS